MTNAVGWLSTLVLDAVFALLAAATVARWSVVPAPVAAGLRLATLVRWTAAVALAIASVDLVVRSLAMADAPLAAVGDVLPTVLAHSRVGHAWLVGTVAIAVLWATAAWRPALSVAALACWAASRAAVSHAGADGLGWPVVVQVLHLFAMGVWAGSVWMAAVRGGWPGAAVGSGPMTADAAERLSSLSTWALGIVVATGLVSAQRRVGSVSALWLGSDAYTGWLRAKLVCVAGAVLLGAVNRWVLLPRLRTARRLVGGEDTTGARFRWLLRIESLLLLAALAAAARLASTEPPNLDAVGAKFGSDERVTRAWAAVDGRLRETRRTETIQVVRVAGRYQKAEP